MALNGAFYGTTSNDRIKPKIEWSAMQSVAGNYSDVTATLYYSRTNTGYTTGGTWQGSISIDDQTFTGSKYIEITYNSNTFAITATARIYHDSYGKKTITISAAGGIVNPSNSTLKTTSIFAAVDLGTIPLASTVSAVNADIGSRSTVVVSRKNDGFTHSIAYQFGTLFGYIDVEGNPVDTEVKLSATTINFLLPESFYEQIPNDPSGVCTLTCCTYSGNTQIGDNQTVEFIATAGYGSCKPEVSGTVQDVNDVTVALTGDSSLLVRYASVARCRITAQARNGARITALRIGGMSVTETENVLDIVNPAFDKLAFEAVDSRGYATVYEVPVTLIPYILLTNNATVQRTDPTSGNAVLTLQGSCWNGNFGEAENTLTAVVAVDGEEQELTVEVGENHRYEVTVALSGLEYTKAYTVAVIVRDGAMSVERALPVQKGIPVFDWGEEDFRFNVPVEVAALTIGGIPLREYIQSIIQGGL